MERENITWQQQNENKLRRSQRLLHASEIATLGGFIGTMASPDVIAILGGITCLSGLVGIFIFNVNNVSSQRETL